MDEQMAQTIFKRKECSKILSGTNPVTWLGSLWFAKRLEIHSLSSFNLSTYYEPHTG